MGKKRKSWVHIDSAIGEGGSSEFDSLGAIEELTEYTEEDLAEIMAHAATTATTSGGLSSKKKRRKSLSNLVSDDLNNARDRHITETKDENNVEKTETINKVKKKKPRRKKKKNKDLNIDKKKTIADESKDDSTELNEPKNNVIENKSTSSQKRAADHKDNHIDLSEIKDKWGNFGIPDEILKGLAVKHFVKPTEIQEKCIPKGISFKDVVGAAETGKYNYL